MQVLQFSVSMRLALIVALAGGLVGGLALPGRAEEGKSSSDVGAASPAEHHQSSIVMSRPSFEESQDAIPRDQEQMTHASTPQLRVSASQTLLTARF
jgi:hypothetical protein